MRFTALFAVMAASAAAAQEYEVPGEETTTLIATTTHTITITECAPDYADCPLNKPTTTVVEVPPTTSEVIIPTSEPVYETPIIETPIIETPSLSPVPPPVEPPVETSSSIPYYPVSNSTTHAGPTAPHTTLLPVSSTVSGNLPVVTETEVVPVPTTPGAAETSEIPQAAAAGVFVQGGLLASMVALGLFGLF
ncbi:hypothetical protein HYQ45_018252 [Verticillium longisporum]|uniref:GPI anchored serine-rich protein n=1 Tax=Verticillium longisporum TaxID=100787 RepID=A0A8I3AGH0_VERLO|nr:hypothetical protein HYQ44_014321 [Verticillium longisporum]KAG7107684.1 hypothetical protein HYQ45_018252 [Verticillium longisporum]